MPDLIAIAKAALLEITAESTIGSPSGQTEADGAVEVTFLANMAGYPGWHWTVAIATLEGEEPSVLEVELMPGNGALLAPDWVPWSERLAEYEAAQEAQAAEEADDAEADDESESDDEHDDDDESDDEHEDDDDDDDLGSDVLHGGDLDGVDIDDPDEDLDDDDDESDDDDDDDDDDESDEGERSF